MIIGIVPNLLSALLVLGIMGIMNLPLDMMTITIAAITVGIAVDNSIHYIYRYREEYSLSRLPQNCKRLSFKYRKGNIFYRYNGNFRLFNLNFVKFYSYNNFWDFDRSCYASRINIGFNLIA